MTKLVEPTVSMTSEFSLKVDELLPHRARSFCLSRESMETVHSLEVGHSEAIRSSTWGGSSERSMLLLRSLEYPLM